VSVIPDGSLLLENAPSMDRIENPKSNVKTVKRMLSEISALCIAYVVGHRLQMKSHGQ